MSACHAEVVRGLRKDEAPELKCLLAFCIRALEPNRRGPEERRPLAVISLVSPSANPSDVQAASARGPKDEWGDGRVFTFSTSRCKLKKKEGMITSGH